MKCTVLYAIYITTKYMIFFMIACLLHRVNNTEFYLFIYIC